MKSKRLSVITAILAIAGALLLIIAFVKPDIYWIKEIAALCSISMAVCVILQNKSPKNSSDNINTKKVIIGMLVGVVLALAAIWIVLINVLKTGLE